MAKTLKTFQPDRGYSQEDWDAVDSPDLTDEELASMVPAREVLPPEFFVAMEEYRLSRQVVTETRRKRRVTLQIDDDVVAKFREGGKGWQGRMGAALRKAVGL